MKRMSLAGLALATLAAGPTLAQAPSAVNRFAAPTDLSPAAQRAARQVESKLEEVGRQLLTERLKLDRDRQVYRPDSEQVQKQEDLVAQLSKLQDSLQSDLQHVIDQDRENQPAVLLSRIVSVSFKDATVPQALEALQKSSRVPMVLDPAVTTNKRLTIAARNVAVGQLLESIAQQTDLEVTLEPASGAIRVQQWPTLAVDGDQRVLKSDTAPWSDTLFRVLSDSGAASNRPDAFFQPIDETNPPRRFVFGGSSHLAVGSGNPFAAGGSDNAVPGGLGNAMGMGFNPAIPGSGPIPRDINPGAGFALAPVADHMVVVAEPGRGPNGEPGVFLTVYRLDGIQLRKVSQVFHRPANGGPTPGAMGAPGMYPGMPGGVPGGFPGNGFGPGGGNFAPGQGGLPGGSGFGGGFGAPRGGFLGGGGFAPGSGAPGGSPLGLGAGAGGGNSAPAKNAPRNGKPAKPKGSDPKAPANSPGDKSK